MLSKVFKRISTQSLKIKFMSAWTKAKFPFELKIKQIFYEYNWYILWGKYLRTFQMSKQQGKIALVLVFVNCTLVQSLYYPHNLLNIDDQKMSPCNYIPSSFVMYWFSLIVCLPIVRHKNVCKVIKLNVIFNFYKNLACNKSILQKGHFYPGSFPKRVKICSIST